MLDTTDTRQIEVMEMSPYELDSVPWATKSELHSPSSTNIQLVSVALVLADIMKSIDETILSTAIPRIASEFNVVNDLGWYGSAYLLTELAFQPLFGSLYVYFEPKSMYLFSLLVFSAGSVLCATAVSSTVFIFGRAVAGFGAAGLLAGSLSIFSEIIPLSQRPRGLAIFTSFSTIAGMLGSTVGGVITESSLTWRFCFWVNLPIIFAAAMLIMYSLGTKKSHDHALSLVRKLNRLDLIGTVLLTSSLVSLFIALQWAGYSFTWSSPRVWGFFLAFGVLAAAFVLSSYAKKERAMIPLRVLNERTVIMCCLFSFLFGSADFTHYYFLPIYFQTVQGTSVAMSGVLALPFTIATTVSTLAAGFAMTASRRYVPFMWFGSLIYMVGSVLLYTLGPDSGHAQYLGFQIVAGCGCGMAIQVALIAVQVVTPVIDIPLVCSMEILFHKLGGTIGISVAGNLFTNSLADTVIQGVEADKLLGESSSILGNISAELRGVMSSGISRAFVIPLVATVLAVPLSFGMEWHVLEDENASNDATFNENEGEVEAAECGDGMLLRGPYDTQRLVMETG